MLDMTLTPSVNTIVWYYSQLKTILPQYWIFSSLRANQPQRSALTSVWVQYFSSQNTNNVYTSLTRGGTSTSSWGTLWSIDTSSLICYEHIKVHNPTQDPLKETHSNSKTRTSNGFSECINTELPLIASLWWWRAWWIARACVRPTLISRDRCPVLVHAPN